jgi:hypothetical protein
VRKLRHELARPLVIADEIRMRQEGIGHCWSSPQPTSRYGGCFEA